MIAEGEGTQMQSSGAFFSVEWGGGLNIMLGHMVVDKKSCYGGWSKFFVLFSP